MGLVRGGVSVPARCVGAGLASDWLTEGLGQSTCSGTPTEYETPFIGLMFEAIEYRL